MWSLGFTAAYLVTLPKNFMLRNLVRLAVGFGIMPILLILLNFLHIPLDWKILLFVTLAFPIYQAAKAIKKGDVTIPTPRLTKTNLVIIVVLLISLLSLYIYTKGAFSYPYLENEDPWGHSEGIKYVSLEKTAYDPPLKDVKEIDAVLSYMDPYPPAYDVLIGILHQTSPNLTWTMKFFNALIISLGFLFFFLFARRFMKNTNKALFATFVLAAIPCYLSHFIWAHSLVITLFFPTMYAFEMIKKDRRWTWLAMLMVASIWVSQNISQPIKLTSLLIIYIIVASVTHRQVLKDHVAALLGGFAVSFVWFGTILYKHKIDTILNYYHTTPAKTAATVSAAVNSVSTPAGSKLIGFLRALVNPGGTASRAYTIEEFFVAHGQNMINNPIGIGVVISILTTIGFVFVLWKYKSSIAEKKNTWLCVTLFWLIFTFWGVNGMTFPISVARGAFRTWMLLAIPVSLIATEGFFFIKRFFRKLKPIQFVVVALILFGVILTSAQQKYELNTAIWPTSSAFGSIQEAYEIAVGFNTLPLNAKVFLYTPRPKIVVGLGRYGCNWCQEELDFRKEYLTKNVVELHSFLRNRGYEYLVINPSMDHRQLRKRYGDNETSNLLTQRYNEISSSGLFSVAYQKEGLFAILKVA